MPDAIVLTLRAAPPATFWTYMAARGMWVLEAAGIAVFGAYRMEALSGLAREAIQLGQYTLRAQEAWEWSISRSTGSFVAHVP